MEPRRSLGVPRASTHAGGIQPSSSFFRPSRPNQSRSLSPLASSPHNHSPILEQNGEEQVIVLSANPDGFENDTGSQLSLDDEPNDSPAAAQGNAGRTAGTSRGASFDIHSSQPQQEGGEPRRSTATNHNNASPSVPSIVTTPAARTSLSQGRPKSPTSYSPSGISATAAGKKVRTSLDALFNLRRGDSHNSTVVSQQQMRVKPSLPFGQAHLAHAQPRRSFGGTTEEEDFDEERSIGLGSYPMRKYAPPSPSISPTHSRPHSQTLGDPHHLFNPVRPPAHPPLSAVPMTDPKAPTKKLKNYRLHPSRNRFFFDGRVLTGGDAPWAFVGCLLIVLGITGSWFGTTCVWWWTEYGSSAGKAVSIAGAYASLLVLSNMLVTAFSDPGILPRDLDPDPPYPTTSPSEGGLKVPLPRDLKVRSDVVRVKYCHTCKTYRPPRSSHCKMCDNCVDDCDHHCQWVNNCIGRRNYGTFFTLLLTGALTLVLVLCTTAFHLAIEASRRGSFLKSISSPRGIGSAVAFSLSVSIIWPVTALLAYHVRLLLLNVTTIEQIRNQAHKTLIPGQAPPNPFSHGNWRRNLIAVLGRPRGYSWLGAHDVATEDRREVNPWTLARQQQPYHGGENGHGVDGPSNAAGY